MVAIKKSTPCVLLNQYRINTLIGSWVVALEGLVSPPSEYTQATAETKTVSGIMAVPAAHFHLLSLNIASMNRTPGIKF